MKPLTTLVGTAAPLVVANINTDIIAPTWDSSSPAPHLASPSVARLLSLSTKTGNPLCSRNQSPRGKSDHPAM